MKNMYLDLVQSGLSTDPRLSNTPDDVTVARTFYTTDTQAKYVWNPAALAWQLHYQLKPVTFANLPTLGKITGSEATVTDATTPTKGGTITGGSSVLTGAIWDGANWRAS